MQSQGSQISASDIAGYEDASSEPDALGIITRLLEEQITNQNQEQPQALPPQYQRAELPKDTSPTIVTEELDASTAEVRATGQILQTEDSKKILHIESIENYGSEKNVGREARDKLLREGIAHGATRITSEIISAAMAHTFADLYGEEKVFRTIDGRRLSPEEAANEINNGTVRIVYLDADIPQPLIDQYTTLNQEEPPFDPETQRKVFKLFDWATAHIPSPCGQTQEERDAQRQMHQKAVLEALAQPGVYEALNESQKEILAKLLDPTFRGYPTAEAHNREEAITYLEQRIEAMRAKNQGKQIAEKQKATDTRDTKDTQIPKQNQPKQETTQAIPQLGEHVLIVEEKIKQTEGNINVLTNNCNEGEWPDPTDSTKKTDLATFIDIILASKGIPSVETLRRQGMKVSARFHPTESRDEGAHDVPGILEITWEEYTEKDHNQNKTQGNEHETTRGEAPKTTNMQGEQRELSPQDQALLERLLMLTGDGESTQAKDNPAKDSNNEEDGESGFPQKKPEPKPPKMPSSTGHMSPDEKTLLEQLLSSEPPAQADIPAPESVPARETNEESEPKWLKNLVDTVNMYARNEAAELCERLKNGPRSGWFQPNWKFRQHADDAVRRALIEEMDYQYRDREVNRWIRLAQATGVDVEKARYIITPDGILRNPNPDHWWKENFYLNDEFPLTADSTLPLLDVLIISELIKEKGKEFSRADVLYIERYLVKLAEKLNVDPKQLNAYVQVRHKRIGVITPRRGKESTFNNLPEVPTFQGEVKPLPKGIVVLPGNASFPEEREYLNEKVNLYFDMQRIQLMIRAGIPIKYQNPYTGEITIYLPRELQNGETMPIEEEGSLTRKGKRYEMKINDPSKNPVKDGIRFRVIHTENIDPENLEKVISKNITRHITQDMQGMEAHELKEYGDRAIREYARPLREPEDKVNEVAEEQPPQQEQTTPQPKRKIPWWDIKGRLDAEHEERINRILAGDASADTEISGQPSPTDWEIEEAHHRNMTPWALREQIGLPWDLKTDEEREKFWEEAHRKQDESRAEEKRQRSLRTQIGRILSAADQAATIGWKGITFIGGRMAHRFFPPGGYQSEEQSSGNWDNKDWQEASGPFSNYVEIFNQAEEIGDGKNNDISEQVDTLLEVEEAIEELQEQTSEIAESTGMQEQEIQQALQEVESNMQNQRVPIRERIRQAMDILRKLSGHSRSRFDYSPLEEEDYSNWSPYETDNESGTGQEQQESQRGEEEFTQMSETQSHEGYGDYPPEYTGPAREETKREKEKIRFNVSTEGRKPRKQKWTGMMSDLQMAFYTQEGRALHKNNPAEEKRWSLVFDKVKAGRSLSEDELEVAKRMVQAVREEERKIEEWERSQQNFSSYGRIRFDEEGRVITD